MAVLSPLLIQTLSRAGADLERIAVRFVAHAKQRVLPALERVYPTDAQMIETSRHRMGELVEFLGRGDRDGYLAQILTRFQTGQTTGQQALGRFSLPLEDVIQTLTAQKLALFDWLGSQPLAMTEAFQLVAEIESLFADIVSGYAATHADLQQEYLHLSAVNENLEAQVRARTHELEAEKTFMENLVAHSPIPIYFIDRSYVFRWANQAYSELVQRPASAIIGQPLFEVFPETEPSVRPRFEQLMATGRPMRMTGIPLAGKIESSHPVFIDVIYVPILDDPNRQGILVLAQDVSARVHEGEHQRSTIQALEEADRLKDQFLGILSHELRTPINAITGFGSILIDEVAGPLTPTQHEYLAKMLSGADTLLGLIGDLLDMSRMQAGKFTLQVGVLHPAETVRQVIGQLRGLAESRELKLELEVAEPMPDVVADPRRIAQVLVNLVGNAIKFTPPGGTVRLSARLEAERLRFEVTDTGPGIAKADLPRLFTPFTQLDMSNTRTVGGTGLGLSICKALVEAHGGSIGVMSEPGVGSTFWFTIPQQPDLVDESPVPAGPAPYRDSSRPG